jgi:RNA polymerase sigma-70 factor (ECF subfamily)
LGRETVPPIGPELVARLLSEHGRALALYARQWTPPEVSPEDIVQDAFVQLARQRTAPPRLVNWLFRVVRNSAISARRAAERRRRHLCAAALQTESWLCDNPDVALDAQTVTEALKTLPIEQRETIVAHLWGGLSFDAIGELTATSSSTAHRRYAAGLEALRQKLGVPCHNQISSHR